MKSVLISIQPKWCEKICNGEKTIEVRKTAPKEVPFKAYIYETKGATETPWADEDGHLIFKGRGQVIGEFICDRVVEWKYLPDCKYDGEKMYYIDSEYGESTCLLYDEIEEYGQGKTLYGWHISDLKIYDKPRELSEFYSIDESGSDCCIACIYHETPLDEMPCRTCTSERRYLYRPPQSWQYVEELGE